jgi:AraC-like DNA-binding protein
MNYSEIQLIKILKYYILVIFLYITFGVSTLLQSNNLLQIIAYGSFLLLSLFVYIIFNRLSYNQIYPLIKPYLYILSGIIIINSFFNMWNNPLYLIWYILILSVVNILFEKQTIKAWTKFFVIVIALSYTYSLIQYLVVGKINNYNIKSSNYYTIFNITIIVFIILFVLTYYLQRYYSMYVNDLKTELENLDDSFIDNHDLNNKNDEITNEDDNQVYINLYNKFIKEFEEKELFLKKDINLHLLSEILNTNTTYLSRAINICSSDNFNTLLNKYRIAYFKNLVNNKEYRTYKLNYLYSKSGFKSQSSFNRAFKSIENKTPSDYLNDKLIL